MIGTNKKDAQETVDAMLADLLAARATAAPRHVAERARRPSAIEALLRQRQPELVTYAGWEAIDRHERALGEPAGRPRVKLTRIEEMLRVAAAEAALSARSAASSPSDCVGHLPHCRAASPVSSSGRAPDF